MASPTAAELVRRRVKELIYKREINQTKLARAVGKSDSWLSGFLKGKTGIAFDVLDDLARELGVEVPDLFVDRDLLRQGSYVQTVLHPLLQGAPDEPAARARYVRELLEAQELVIAALVDQAATALESQSRPPQPDTPSDSDRDRKTRGKRHRKLDNK